MPGPFDITTKYLVQTYPRDWLGFLGLPARGQIEVIEADLSTVTAEADKVIRVSEPEPWLLHLEFQASYEAQMGRRLARYNLLLAHQHELDVVSLLVLLRREADGPATRGRWQSAPRVGLGSHDFRYPVLRVWTEPVKRLLAGPLGLLPLAPLADLTGTDLPAVMGELERRIEAEATPVEAQTLEVVTFTLMGLRYPPELARQLISGVRDMRESSTYQMILDEGRTEGRTEEARQILLRLGTLRLGPPDPPAQAIVAAIAEPERLEQLAERLLLTSPSSWAELLGEAQ